MSTFTLRPLNPLPDDTLLIVQVEALVVMAPPSLRAKAQPEKVAAYSVGGRICSVPAAAASPMSYSVTRRVRPAS